MGLELVASIAVSLVTGGSAVWAARAARRTPKQERRDDFTTIVTELRTDLKNVKSELGEQKAEATEQRQRLAGQDFAIRYLTGWVRSLYGDMRRTGIEPPAPPQPMPTEVRQYLDDLGV